VSQFDHESDDQSALANQEARELKRQQDDVQLGIDAEKEALAQLEVIRALKPLNRESRQRVLEALSHLLEAEQLVPGIFAALANARGDGDAVRAALARVRGGESADAPE
jgi:hypothetical protein